MMSNFKSLSVVLRCAYHVGHILDLNSHTGILPSTRIVKKMKKTTMITKMTLGWEMRVKIAIKELVVQMVMTAMKLMMLR
jgi:hypothetical protein